MSDRTRQVPPTRQGILSSKPSRSFNRIGFLSLCQACLCTASVWYWRIELPSSLCRLLMYVGCRTRTSSPIMFIFGAEYIEDLLLSLRSVEAVSIVEAKTYQYRCMRKLCNIQKETHHDLLLEHSVTQVCGQTPSYCTIARNANDEAKTTGICRRCGSLCHVQPGARLLTSLLP